MLNLSFYKNLFLNCSFHLYFSAIPKERLNRSTVVIALYYLVWDTAVYHGYRLKLQKIAEQQNIYLFQIRERINTVKSTSTT